MKGYAGDVAFVTDGAIQMHLATKDIHAGFNSGQIVNPVERGHIAYRCDDIEAFKAHLDEKGVPYSDWSHQAVAGWHQIFFYDPDGNVIEVHQVDEEADLHLRYLEDRLLRLRGGIVFHNLIPARCVLPPRFKIKLIVLFTKIFWCIEAVRKVNAPGDILVKNLYKVIGRPSRTDG